MILVGLYQPPSELAARYIGECDLPGGLPRGKTPVTPDEPDVLDTGDGVQGVGAGGWRRVRRVRRVYCWFLVGPISLRLPEHGYLLLQRQVLKNQLTLRFEQGE